MTIEELFYPDVMRSTACEDTPYPILKSAIIFQLLNYDIFAYIPYPFDITSDDRMNCTYEEDTFSATIYDVHIYDGIPFVFRFIRIDTATSNITTFYVERLSSKAAESFQILENIRLKIEESGSLIKPRRHLGIAKRIIEGETFEIKDFSFFAEGIKCEYVDIVSDTLYNIYKIIETKDQSLPEDIVDLLIAKLPQFPLIIMGIFRQLSKTDVLKSKLKNVDFSKCASDFGYQIRLARKLKSIYN